MAFEYRSLEVALPGEKPTRLSSESSSTLQAIDDLDYLSHDSELCYQYSFCETASRWVKSKWLWAVHAALLFTSCGMLVMTMIMRSSTLYHIRQVSAWSPADVSVQYSHVRYNITTKGNPFVGAGPEVDKAWREISYDMGDQWIPKHDISKLDMPETSLKVNHPITGEEGYRVGMEVFHHLHCLNLLRRVTYKDYYEPLGGEFGHGPEALQAHTGIFIDHCIEVLRQNIQCNADIGLFTFYMIPDDPLAWPELNSKHVCRNFDNVRRWALDHSVGNMEVLEQ
ncbi:hypothetical protein M441DRAFT_84843 [Trichoderma asperellum CBS 433.97]|uniref:Tat pathway signal sequence n=1 Tax=Trichoderma asperellum (strain ATCC 204424 / CBS 433.97 / NBRC 101777) TaxID=1042311 RepID=A0A2T3YRP8_TRIA4|nr:hypothetical protein M441DRAFT_84843 [Trichoderma asperellum CBS 433.97]PTB35199.1 hypothetical protein M441DRAFT_84843 [Trichoderma asperellum CBS 433.97]